jgi:hypothetical protein
MSRNIMQIDFIALQVKITETATKQPKYAPFFRDMIDLKYIVDIEGRRECLGELAPRVMRTPNSRRPSQVEAISDERDAQPLVAHNPGRRIHSAAFGDDDTFTTIPDEGLPPNFCTCKKSRQCMPRTRHHDTTDSPSLS